MKIVYENELAMLLLPVYFYPILNESIPSSRSTAIPGLRSEVRRKKNIKMPAMIYSPKYQNYDISLAMYSDIETAAIMIKVVRHSVKGPD